MVRSTLKLAMRGLLLTATLTALAGSAASYGQEYQPPTSPPLFESNGDRGTPLKFPSGPYVTGLMGFGQSRSAGGGANPIAAYTVGAEVGYVAGTGSWSRYEAALEFLTGKVGHSEASLPINYGFIAKIGSGYSLGHNIFGVWRIGAGMVGAKYSGTTGAGYEAFTDDTNLGTALQFSYLIEMPMNDVLTVVGGADWTNYSFNIAKAHVDNGLTNYKDINTSIDENIVVNVPKMVLGVRLGI